MSSRRVVDRFEIVSEAHQPRWEWSRHPDDREFREDDLWTFAVDHRTGARVRLLDTGKEFWRWADDLWIEAIARHVAAAGWSTVPIVHVGPGVVFAEPPPVGRPRLPPAQAAACALAACEVVAGLHAMGCGGQGGSNRADLPMPLDFGPHNLRLSQGTDGWSIAWIVPSSSNLWILEPERRGVANDPDPVAHDLARLADFYLSLAPRRPGHPPAVDALRRIRAGQPICRDVAALARLLLTFVADPGAWEARVAALPVVTALPPPALDWDLVIADGERRLPRLVPRQRDYTAFPLAAAYHQRATSATPRAPDVALRDIDRALELDPIAPYHTTRAVLLDRLGRRDDARAAIAAAFARPELTPAPRVAGEVITVAPRWLSLDDRERARSHATRGTIARRDGDLALAERDLRRAFELAPTAAHAHALAAVHYARGELDSAAALEGRAVELEPASACYRWDLVISLIRLGRRDEALLHARKVLAVESFDPTRRARLQALLGGV